MARMTTETESRPVTVLLPVALDAAARELARIDDRSLSSVFRQALAEYLAERGRFDEGFFAAITKGTIR